MNRTILNLIIATTFIVSTVSSCERYNVNHRVFQADINGVPTEFVFNDFNTMGADYAEILNENTGDYVRFLRVANDVNLPYMRIEVTDSTLAGNYFYTDKIEAALRLDMESKCTLYQGDMSHLNPHFLIQEKTKNRIKAIFDMTFIRTYTDRPDTDTIRVTNGIIDIHYDHTQGNFLVF